MRCSTFARNFVEISCDWSRPSLPGEACERLEKALELFEAAWERGGTPALEHYLAARQAQRATLLIQLVHKA
jgi:hypothetical protein